MSKDEKGNSLIPNELIASKILLFRGQKVIIDSDIAKLYGVTTKRLNERVKRNENRFPNNFMFSLTQHEKDEVVANCDHLEKIKYSPHLPKVFTEHGIMMLANVLKSEQAINMSIKIIEVFIEMREVLFTHKDLLLKMQEIEQRVTTHDEKLTLIFEYIKQFEKAKRQQLNQKNRKQIGYKTND